MSAATYEYKTVALPQTVQGKRRRGVSEADLVAETLGELIHLEAVDGWEYLRSDILAAGSRGGMFSKEMRVTYYSVLVFRRVMEDVWSDAEMAAVPPRPAPHSTPPRPAPAPKSAPKPRIEAYVAPPAVDDPTSPLARGGVLTTGGQIRTDGDGNPSIRLAEKPSPRPPLGSAQD